MGALADQHQVQVAGAASDEQFTAALNELPPPDSEVIGYRYLLSLSESETAEVLGVRLGTVKSRLSRAMARLRLVLEDVG